MKQKFKKLWKWLRKEALNKEMIVFVLIAEFIFWLPVIVCSVFAIIFSPWWWTIVGAICLFWAGPFTPAVPLQLALAVVLRKLYNKIKNKKK